MGDDLAQLDATAQAELVRNGDATADRARRPRRSTRIEKLQPS